MPDGTLAGCDRVGDGRADYSHKHRRHGVNVQVVTDPAGQLLWISPALPGHAHDLTAARTHRIIRICERQGIPVLADRACLGAGPWVTTPVRRPPGGASLTRRTVNRALSAARAPVERGVARLKSWRIFREAVERQWYEVEPVDQVSHEAIPIRGAQPAPGAVGEDDFDVVTVFEVPALDLPDGGTRGFPEDFVVDALVVPFAEGRADDDQTAIDDDQVRAVVLLLSASRVQLPRQRTGDGAGRGSYDGEVLDLVGRIVGRARARVG